MKRLPIYGLILVALAFAGCSKDGGGSSDSPAYFAGSGSSRPTVKTIASNSDGLFVTIKSPGDWSLAISYPAGAPMGWCTVAGSDPSSTYGTGDAEVWITTTANILTSSRTATITVSVAGRNIPLTLTQTSPEQDILLEVAQATPGAVAWNADGVSVNITSTVSWNISFAFPDGTPVWCSMTGIAGTGDASVWVVTNTNRIMQDRTVTMNVTGGGLERSLQITQQAKPATPTPDSFYADRVELAKIFDNDWFLEYTAGEFALEYDCTKKHSKWVAWQLYASHMIGGSRSDYWSINPDVRIPYEYRAVSGDYSGFNRGHLCSSGERVATAEMNHDTFYYSNMSPQYADLNQGVWGRLEDFERKWAEVAGDTLYICAGGAITNDQPILKYNGKGVAVPKYNFKVILRKKQNGTYNAIGFWFENKAYSSRKKDYFLSMRNELLRSVDEIEEYTGLDFFYGLPEGIQSQVEQQKNLNDWNWN